MSEIVLDVPEETLLALKVAPEQAAEALRLVAAVKLFELRRLSAGAAARLAGIPKPLFLQKLGEYGVSTFDWSEQELNEELEHA